MHGLPFPFLHSAFLVFLFLFLRNKVGQLFTSLVLRQVLLVLLESRNMVDWAGLRCKPHYPWFVTTSVGLVSSFEHTSSVLILNLLKIFIPSHVLILGSF
jgi:hypothetical protein